MSRPDVAAYVEDFFTRLFCASDDAEAVSTINAEIAEDADMVINGNPCTRDQFSQLNVQGFRAMCEAKITDVKDLNILTEDGRTGLVSQLCTFEIKVMATGDVTRQTATTIMRVSPKGGG